MSKPAKTAKASAAAETLPVLAAASSPAGLGLKPVRHERFAERVYDSLFHSIMTGKLAPDTRLPPEVQLASFFQVSRPVVRQALDRLRQDRLVEPIRGSGTYVRAGGASLEPAQPATWYATDMSHIVHGLELRQGYPRVGKLALMKHQRYAHAKQVKRARRELRTRAT